MSNERWPLAVFHGLTRGEITGALRMPFFVAYDEQLAADYADDGAIVAFELAAANPLRLSTPQAFVAAWQTSGADEVAGPFHPNQTRVFAEWARRQGYDAILIPESAFAGDDGFEEVGGRVGEPQIIVLDPTVITRREHQRPG